MNYRFLQRLLENSRDIFDYACRDPFVAANLERIRKFDVQVLNHCLRVTVLSLLCGVPLALNRQQLNDLCTGALLHDLGKTCLKKAVLNKPGKLTPDEFTHLKTHSRCGYDLIKGQGLGESIAQIALQHHERFDGLGYPLGSAGRQINRLARIVALADSFEALTVGRIYRGAFPFREAVAIIKDHTGTQFDPKVSTAFFTVLGNPQSFACFDLPDRLYPVNA